MSKRELAALVLGKARVGRMRSRRNALRILAYHRLVPKPWENFRFDVDNISATPKTFEEQLKWVTREYDVVSFRDLANCDRAGEPWPKRALILSFDDGYRDNYELAYPLLKTYRVPAIIFLSTGHIGNDVLFWWDAVSYAINSSQKPKIEVPEVQPLAFRLGNAAEKLQAIAKILAWAKTVPDERRFALVNRLPQECEIMLPPEMARQMILSWDEVREMTDGGMEMGSHTASHPILRHVRPERLKVELETSKARIELETGQPVSAFAYPAGTRSRRNAAAEAAVEAAGYSYAVAYDQGVAHPHQKFALPRIHVYRQQSQQLFRASLAFPELLLR